MRHGMGRPRKDPSHAMTPAERKRAQRAREREQGNGVVQEPKLAIARSETTDPTQTETWEGIDMDEAYRMGLRGEDVPRAEPDDDHPEGLRVRHGAREQAWRIAAPDNTFSEEQRAENAARYEAWWNSPTERAWRASYDARQRAKGIDSQGA